MKQGDAVDSLEGQESLQRDRVLHWAVINEMKFNKSKGLDLAPGMEYHGHELEEQWLEISPVEGDLGVLVSSSSL